MLKNKNILLGVTGGIAAYKSVDLASRLVKEGAKVKVILTENAQNFITPITFRSITGESVVTKLFDSEAPIEHISLAEWADLLIIAPATANIIGKIASGIADDLLSTTVMAATSAKLLVPAMNSFMWENPIVRENTGKLEKLGYTIIPPETGRLACGYEGKGRFPDVAEIIYFIRSALYFQDREDSTNKEEESSSKRRILITAGACREYLDPMRYLSNDSSGKMGLALARAAYHRGADVTLITGHITEKVPYYLKTVSGITSEEMSEMTLRYAEGMDMIIMTAAITDFQPEKTEVTKIKKSSLPEEGFSLNLKPTTDVLRTLGNRKEEKQILVGFAAETDDLIKNARKKLTDKNCDFIVANNISVAGKNDTELAVISKKEVKEIRGTKFLAAHQILDYIEE